MPPSPPPPPPPRSPEASSTRPPVLVLVLVTSVKVWTLALLLWPVWTALHALGSPRLAYAATAFMAVTFTSYAALHVAQAPIDRTAAFALAPAATCDVLLLLFHVRLVSQNVFVALLGVVTVLLAFFMCVLSVLVGHCRWVRVQQACTSCGILAPLAGSIAWILTGCHVCFRIACFASTAASLFNVFFNKSRLSIGLPRLTPQRVRHDYGDEDGGGRGRGQLKARSDAAAASAAAAAAAATRRRVSRARQY